MEEAAVHRLATSITLTLCQVAEEIDTATKLVYKACQKLRDIPDVPPQRITDLENVTRQLLWCGRSRSKARSLHENKLLSKKLQHGHRWSHANWQIIKTKKQNTPTKRQDADPPARYASHLPKDSEANSERGKSPTETTTKKICQRHSGTDSKACSKRISCHPMR